MNILDKMNLLESVVGATPEVEVTEMEIMESGYELVIEGVEVEAAIAREQAMMFAHATRVAIKDGAEAAAKLDTDNILIEADTSEGTADEKKEKMYKKIWEWVKKQIAKIKEFASKTILYIKNLVGKQFGKGKELAKEIGDKEVKGPDFDAMLKAYNKIKSEIKATINSLTVVNLTKTAGAWAKIMKKAEGEGHIAKLAGWSTSIAGLSASKLDSTKDLFAALDANKEVTYTEKNIAEVARVKSVVEGDSLADVLKKHMDRFEANVEAAANKAETGKDQDAELAAKLRGGIAALSTSAAAIMKLERDIVLEMLGEVNKIHTAIAGSSKKEEEPAEPAE